MRVGGTIFRVLLCTAFVSTIVWGCASGETSRSLSKTEKAQLLIQAANGALQEGDPTSALQLLKQAEQTGGGDLPEFHLSRAVAFFAKHDTMTALECARRAGELRPDSSPINNTLGKLLLDSGKYREAEKHLSVAANDPLYREAYKANTNLGILYYRTEDFAKAIAHLDKAISDAPNDACIAYYYRGHINLHNGDFKKAAKDYDKATRRLCAGFADAHLALGIALARDKQYDKARKKFLDVKNSFPDSKVAEQAMEQLRFIP